MHKVYLLIGGNMGNRDENLDKAVQLMGERAGKVTSLSAIFETAAWGITEQPPFLNQVIELQTDLTPLVLIKKLLDIETELGRVRKEKNGPRVIDIDMLFYDYRIIHEKILTVPHPEIQNRRFALAPMNDLAPDFVHPILQKTISRLLAECPDQLPVFIHNKSR